MPFAIWRQSFKGYVTSYREVRAVVFMPYRRPYRWNVVVDDEFMPRRYGHLDAAIQVAEERLRQLSGAPPALDFDRHFLRDVPPWRRDVPPPPPGARQRGPLHGRAPKPAPPPKPSWAVALGLDGAGPWSAAEVRAAWLRLAKQHHPDRGGTLEAMQRINAAYEAAQKAVLD